MFTDDWTIYCTEAQLLAKENKLKEARAKNFKNKSGWSFDPRLNGFYTSKVYNKFGFIWQGHLTRKYKKNDISHTVDYFVRRQNNGTYLVLIEHKKTLHLATDKSDQTFECEFPDQYGWESFLKDHGVI